MGQLSGWIDTHCLLKKKSNMRAKEFIRESSGSTVSGGIATVSQPLGEIQTRQQLIPKTKYANAYTKPWASRKTHNAR